LLCFLFCALLLIGALVLWFFIDLARRRAIEHAWDKHQDALETLSKWPHSAQWRKEALYLGRRYARLLNSSSAFSEITIMNDLNAACAGSGAKEP